MEVSASLKSDIHDKYWLENPGELLDFKTLIPTSDMTPNQTHNTMLRVVILVSIFLALLFSNTKLLYIIPVAAALSVLTMYIKRKEDFLMKEKLQKKNLDFVDDKVCVKSTVENPFMNVLMSDYDQNVDRPAACPVDNEKVQEEIADNFDARLFKDVSDVFSKMHSQRQYYTMPSTTIPNDQQAFVEYLYGGKQLGRNYNGVKSAE